MSWLPVPVRRLAVTLIVLLTLAAPSAITLWVSTPSADDGWAPAIAGWRWAGRCGGGCGAWCGGHGNGSWGPWRPPGVAVKVGACSKKVEGGDTMTYEKPDVESRIDVKGIMGNKGGAGTKSGGGYP